jgi:hypothetical protein
MNFLELIEYRLAYADNRLYFTSPTEREREREREREINAERNKKMLDGDGFFSSRQASMRNAKFLTNVSTIVFSENIASYQSCW